MAAHGTPRLPDRTTVQNSEPHYGETPSAPSRRPRATVAEPLGHVAVMASREPDGERVIRLLQRANYRAQSLNYAAVDTAGTESDASSGGGEPAATVICHRQSPGVPVPRLPENYPGHRLIVLSDCRSESVVVQTLEAGAHHFFCIDESETILQVRLAAALRQHWRSAERQLVIEPFTFDLQKRRVYLHGSALDLSPKEYEFAYYLFAHRGRVITNDELMTSVWSLPRTMDTRRIDTAACRVRKKMLSANKSTWRLRRLRRLGYELYTEKRPAGAP